MSKHINQECLYRLPSGLNVYPKRLIIKDGTIMWSHALTSNSKLHIPSDVAHEAHIVKTAQRLEELNSWVSKDLDLWDYLHPLAWYVPCEPELSEGISVRFTHTRFNNYKVYDILKEHVLPHEELQNRQEYLFFRRC